MDYFEYIIPLNFLNSLFDKFPNFRLNRLPHPLALLKQLLIVFPDIAQLPLILLPQLGVPRVPFTSSTPLDQPLQLPIQALYVPLLLGVHTLLDNLADVLDSVFGELRRSEFGEFGGLLHVLEGLHEHVGDLF